MSIVRPWNEFRKETTAVRRVDARAVFTAFSIASAPLLKNALFPAGSGAISRIRLARATYGS